MNQTNLKYIFKYLYTRNFSGFTGLIILTLLVLIAITANIISPFNPDNQILEFSSKPVMFSSNVLIIKSSQGFDYLPISTILSYDSDSVKYLDYSSQKKSISLNELCGKDESEWHKNLTFYLGTDRYGRDLLSRMIYGSRISLSVGLISQTIALIIGVLLGSLAGFYRGITDKAISFLINVVWAFPSVLLVIAFSVVLGKGYWQAFVAIGLTSWVDIARIVRGQSLSIREKEYIESSKAVGFNNIRIIMRHVVPNTLAPVFVASTVGLANAIVFEASLSFLGLGVQPPASSWGQMIYDGYKYIITGSNMSLAVFPVVILTLTVISINLLGDALRDIFDPKSK